MKKQTDCLLIGHNEMDFPEYEKICRGMGVNSGAYRDLRLNFIRYNHTPYTASGVFNLLNTGAGSDCNPLRMSEAFSGAISCLGSYLDKHGISFDYVNSFREHKSQLAEKLQAQEILTVAIITTLYVVALPIIEIIRFVKTYNQTAKIVVGGPFISTQIRTLDAGSIDYLFQHTLEADFYVNSSQGEAALAKIIGTLKNRLPYDSLANIHYRDGSKIVATPTVPEDNPLSENPVNWDLFAEGLGEFVNLRTAISCPFCCSFCGYPQHAGTYRTAGVQWIENQLNQLAELGTVKSVHFIDDTFNVPITRFKEILRMIVKNKYPFKWHSYFRCQYADRETIELIKASGCEGVFLGIESGNDRMLKNMNKGSDLQKYQAGISLLKEYGIVTFGSFITGFPGETPESVRDTVHFIENSGLDFYRTQLWYCEPITPIWKERETYRLQGKNFEWSHATMNAKTACDLIDDMFLSVKNAVWIPQYDFDFVSIWYLTHRGFSLDQVKDFLKNFTRGVAEKLTHPSQGEISDDIFKRLALVRREGPAAGAVPPHPEDVVKKYGADFDY